MKHDLMKPVTFELIAVTKYVFLHTKKNLNTFHQVPIITLWASNYSKIMSLPYALNDSYSESTL